MVVQEKLELFEMAPLFESRALTLVDCFVTLAVVVAKNGATVNQVEAFCSENYHQITSFEGLTSTSIHLPNDIELIMSSD